MEIVVHSKNSLFQYKFQKKLYHFNRYSQLRSVMYKTIQFDFRRRSRAKNLTPVHTPSVVRNPTPLKNLRLRLRNPVYKYNYFHPRKDSTNNF